LPEGAELWLGEVALSFAARRSGLSGAGVGSQTLSLDGPGEQGREDPSADLGHLWGVPGRDPVEERYKLCTPYLLGAAFAQRG